LHKWDVDTKVGTFAAKDDYYDFTGVSWPTDAPEEASIDRRVGYSVGVVGVSKDKTKVLRKPFAMHEFNMDIFTLGPDVRVKTAQSDTTEAYGGGWKALRKDDLWIKLLKLTP